MRVGTLRVELGGRYYAIDGSEYLVTKIGRKYVELVDSKKSSVKAECRENKLVTVAGKSQNRTTLYYQDLRFNCQYAINPSKYKLVKEVLREMLSLIESLEGL
jgi:hypothetical protein